jgi:hypothetical protein
MGIPFYVNICVLLLQLIGINPVFGELHENNIEVRHMRKQKSAFKLLGKVARIGQS